MIETELKLSNRAMIIAMSLFKKQLSQLKPRKYNNHNSTILQLNLTTPDDNQ